MKRSGFIHRELVIGSVVVILLSGCSSNDYGVDSGNAAGSITYDEIVGDFDIKLPIFENIASYIDMKDSGYYTEYLDFRFDADGQCISKKAKSSDGTAYTYYMEYCDDGQLASTSIYDEYNELYAVYEYEYDEHGNVTKTIFDFDGSIDSYTYEYEYEGELIVGQTTYYEYDWTLSYITEYSNYSYDENNNILGFTISNSSTNTIEAVQFTYDGAGRKVIEKNGTKKYIYGYDANGFNSTIEAEGIDQKYVYEAVTYSTRASSEYDEIKDVSHWSNIENTSIPDPTSCIENIEFISRNGKNMYTYKLPDNKEKDTYFLYQGIVSALDNYEVLIINGSAYAIRDGKAAVSMAITSSDEYGYIMTVEILSGRDRKSVETLQEEKDSVLNDMRSISGYEFSE